MSAQSTPVAATETAPQAGKARSTSPREARFDAIRTNGSFDVVVVGGGINGVGVHRELSLQGLRVLLVERADFCSGCSSAPSRMIHGGLRYLENGEFGLVRESLHERDALLRNAPHMVKPLATVVPITSVFSGLFNAAASFFHLSSRPTRRGAVPLRIGLSIYDWVTRTRRVLPRHRLLGAGAAFQKWPKLVPEMKFAAVFYDAWISHPERLGVELILDTERLAEHSVALNYAEIAREGAGFVVTDGETGDRYDVTARTVVNATGAWLDESLTHLVPRGELPSQLVEGTKGSHLVLDSPALHEALNGHMVYFDNSDGRICVVFDYLGKVLAGSTDIKVQRAERVRCEDEEREYILDSLRAVFPSVPVNAEQIVYSFSGIRPLLKSDHEFTGRITRGHDIKRIDGDVPMFCMIGGKWTTFRAFAHDTTDEVLAELGQARTASTVELAIGGGRGFSDAAAIEADLIRAGGVSASRAAHLVEAYGTRAAEVLEFCSARDDDQAVASGVPVTSAEVAFMVRKEHATRLADVIMRRTTLAITGAVDSELIEGIAIAAGSALGWSEERRLAEIAELTAELENYHGVDSDALDRRAKVRTMR